MEAKFKAQVIDGETNKVAANLGEFASTDATQAAVSRHMQDHKFGDNSDWFYRIDPINGERTLTNKIITVTAYGADKVCASSSEIVSEELSVADFQEAMDRVKEAARLKYYDEQEGASLLGFTHYEVDYVVLV